MVQLFKSTGSKKTNQQPIKRLQIDALDNQGRGVARDQGKVVFVEGALPGEQVEVRITTHKKDFAVAQVHKIVHASAARQTAPCKWYQECGGCQLQHFEAQAQLAAKQAFVDGLFSKIDYHGLPWQTAIAGDSFAYRNRARLATWYEGKKNCLHIGFRRASSKKLVEIDACMTLAHPLSQQLPALSSCLNQLSIKKNIQHVELHHVTQSAFVILRTDEQVLTEDIQILAEFERQYQVYFVALSGVGTVIGITPNCPALSTLSYSIAGVQIHTDLTSFNQINSQINIKMIAQARRWLSLSAQDTLADFFCGSGNFSLPLSCDVAQVYAYEGVAHAIKNAQLSVQQNGFPNLQFKQIDLTDKQALTQIPWTIFDKILLDPSREGALELCRLSKTWRAQAVLYIACDANALVRDGQVLLANGYEIDKIGLLDMFPHTAHVETMALFKKIQ